MAISGGLKLTGALEGGTGGDWRLGMKLVEAAEYSGGAAAGDGTGDGDETQKVVRGSGGCEGEIMIVKVEPP